MPVKLLDPLAGVDQNTGIARNTPRSEARNERIDPMTAASRMIAALAAMTAAATIPAGSANGAGSPSLADLPSAPSHIVANVPESAGYRLVYQLPIPDRAFDPSQYVVDNSKRAAEGSFRRIAYYMELESETYGKQFVWVSMDAFTKDAQLIGVPKTAEHTQQKIVERMNVVSNVPGVVNGTGLSGNIEFWRNNYGGQPTGIVPGGSSIFDFDDTRSDGGDHASMQVHNFGAKQTVFGYNHWNRNAAPELGIGNQPQGNPDWTFAGNGAKYRVKNLYVLVAPLAPGAGREHLEFLYGQCIANLDRRPYGGGWAEMVEDRKFFHAIGQTGSPWQTIGADAAARMDAGGPFVGKHSPRIALSGGQVAGIAQGGLSLAAGKSYVGHVWLAGTPDAAPVEVKLVWAFGQDGRQVVAAESLSETFQKTPLRFTAGADAGNARLEISSTGRGSFRVGAVSLMPEESVEGFREDALRWLKALYTPLYRWPGGDFLAGYDWKEGIGDRDRRPPRQLASSEVDQNDVGIDEFLAFCRLLHATPCIAVNTASGGEESAVGLLEYCNGAAGTRMGTLRAQYGHPAPCAVRWWEIGAELYDPRQADSLAPDKYAEGIQKIAAAMAKADPSIRLTAAGGTAKTSETLLEKAGDRIGFIGQRVYGEPQSSLDDHVMQLATGVQAAAAACRDYRLRLAGARGSNIRLAVDEWGYAYGPRIWGELGTHPFLRDALGVALGLHELIRQQDVVFMACFAQTSGSVGSIKVGKTATVPTSCGLVLKLYRQRFGTLPVWLAQTPPLDTVAALTADRKRLTIAAVNPTAQRQRLPIAVPDVAFAGTGAAWQIVGGDLKAINVPGRPLAVTIENSLLDGIRDQLMLPPFSITVIALDVQPPPEANRP
jgi:alpha-N-arabinofuranosidase